MPLSDVAIRAAKPREKVVKLSDGAGLQLWLMPNGSKLWRVAYRLDGKQRVLALGAYPQVDLKEARRKREHTNKLLVSGLDPVQQRALDRAVRSGSNATTFATIAAELLDKKRREGKASNTIGKREWLYGLAGEAFGKRPIRDVTAPEVLTVLRKIEEKGHHETARRMRSAIGEVFRYAIATARGESDPTQALRGALTTPTVKHRAAVTDAKALGALLRAVGGFQGQPTTTAALKLMAYLFPRPGELRLAE